MRFRLIVFMWFSFHFAVGQQADKLRDFLKAYQNVVDPTHALDTVKSITLQVHWFVESDIFSIGDIDQYRIRYISSDSRENFNLVLKPEGWTKRGKSRLDSGPMPAGIEKIREHFFLLDTGDIENLAIKFSNDSITVFEKKTGRDFGKTFTFDTKTKLPIGYEEYISNHPEGRSISKVKYDNFKTFANLLVQTKIKIDFDHHDTYVTQTLINVHFNLTPEQAMELKN